MYGYGVCAKFFHGHRVIVLKVVVLFSIVVIRIRPSFPVLEFFLTGKVLTGQADYMLVNIYVNDGGRVLFVQRIVALSIEHNRSSVPIW